jgi:RecB family endonuclease NucS
MAGTTVPPGTVRRPAFVFQRRMEKTLVQTPLTQVTEQQKVEILDLLQQGRSSQEIAQTIGLHWRQVSAIKAHVGMGTYAVDTAEAPEVIQALETTFGLERDLQHALRANIGQLEAGLTITDGGKEQTVASGRIDILAEDAKKRAVVIELKVGKAERDAIGQILSYMGDLSETSPTVRGIVVAGDFSPSAISAARATSNIRLLKYAFKFSFEAVGPS